MLKKVILAVLILPLLPVAYFLATGAIGLSSISMILNTMNGNGIETPSEQTLQQRLQVPAGYSINLYAANLTGVRYLKSTSAGGMLATLPRKGEIVLLEHNAAESHKAGSQKVVLSGLTNPMTVDVFDGWLYVGESNAIGRIQFDETSGITSGEYQQIVTGLTDDGGHRYKIINIGPDKKLYLSQGSTCNVCVEEDSRRSTISRFELDGSNEQLIASGLRNTMGFDWAPWSGELYGTDNGRDLLGDDFPPCELNKIEVGGFYGWPYFNGDNQVDPDFSQAPAELQNPIAPVHHFKPHNAPLGMTFAHGTPLPGFEKSAFAALHGSWNRSTPDGYKVVALSWGENGITSSDFLSGFLVDGDVIGRPVDVEQGTDGALYISDDYAGAIYRVSYGETTYVDTKPTEQAQESAGRDSIVQPDWLNDEQAVSRAQQGETLFSSLGCAGCHTGSSTGKSQLNNISDRLSATDIIAVLENPVPPMPKLPLSRDDKKALATYLSNNTH